MPPISALNPHTHGSHPMCRIVNRCTSSICDIFETIYGWWIEVNKSLTWISYRIPLHAILSYGNVGNKLDAIEQNAQNVWNTSYNVMLRVIQSVDVEIFRCFSEYFCMAMECAKLEHAPIFTRKIMRNFVKQMQNTIFQYLGGNGVARMTL